MTNPNNAIGTNGAFSGRTSPNALNDLAAAFSSGIVSGWTCSPKSGMTVQLGGSASVRDTALAEDNAGNKLTINNRSGAPVEITLDGAPSTNNRIDAIVAYVDNPSTGDDSTTDNPTACGIIAVKGTVAASPSAPSDAQIRAAITTDGATGGVAYYVVLATILVGTNVTTIGSGVIAQGAQSTTENFNIPAASITTAKLANDAVTPAKIDWTNVKNVIRTVLYTGPSAKTGNFQLSDSAANYDALYFEYRHDNDGDTIQSMILESPNSKSFRLGIIRGDGSTLSIYGSRYSISGTTVTINSGSAVAFNNGGQAGFGNGSEIKILSVVGLKLSD
jgi:hypothetical protein